MEWWLNVFFLINHVWVPGYELEGWGPRRHPSEQVCLAHKETAEEYCRRVLNDRPALWVCSPGAPLRQVPDDLDTRAC